MAGWSLFSCGSSSDSAEILQDLRRSGICPDSDKTSKFRCLFDLIHSHFIKEISPKQEILPSPVMVGDGQSVDLFKLYWVVKEKGGYGGVTDCTSWGAVGEESGLGADVGTSVKLVYKKYLEPLDRWLWRIVQEKGIQWLWRIIEDEGIAGGLDAETKELLREALVGKKGHAYRELGEERNEVGETPARGKEPVEVKESVCDDDDEVVVLESYHANGVSSSIKRKREGEEEEDGDSSLKRKVEEGREGECVFKMLNWVKKIAKGPGDPAVGKALEGSRRNLKEVEYRKQAFVARKALLIKRRTAPCVVRSLLQRRQKMHPSMYEDYLGSDNQSRLRCSQRLLFRHMRSDSSSCSEMSAASDDSDKSHTPLVSWIKDDADKQVLKTLGSFTAETVVRLFSKDQIQKQVPVGPQFQANVPDWTGIACNSDDSKWLGTQIWPPKPTEVNSSIEEQSIGKGRPDSCSCKLPGSVECVRFHVAEKRFQLKRELGSAFYKWRFHHMGEEVSLSWTDEEERRFKVIVYKNPPSLDKSFWEEAYRTFCYKGRQSLVNYYFDAFLLRRRSYQNRVTPNHIDSDDEESEFGSASSGFGHDAVNVHGFKSIVCAQNKQCMELDDTVAVD